MEEREGVGLRGLRIDEDGGGCAGVEAGGWRWGFNLSDGRE